jgi:SAM-dependent methyltransferase
MALTRGRRVLDAACGEGYGSALLARAADSVLGLDMSEQALAHARARYGDANNLRFERMDCTRLDVVPAASFDLIVSFETLEHVEAHEEMLDGFARLLAPGGLLLISTPDRHNYSDVAGFDNEHHVRELYRNEFESLLDARFAHKRLYAHKLLFQSAMWDLARGGDFAAATMHEDGSIAAALEYPPLYYVAVCAREADAIDALPALSLFGDSSESVYSHYNGEVRKNMHAGHRILELEQQLEQERTAHAALRASLAPKSG